MGKVYECEGCGACCSISNPFTGLGRCPELTEDNKCAMFDSRPDICRSDKVARSLGLTDEEYCEKAEAVREVLREIVYGPGGMSDVAHN
ncbi:hypothetical protein LCGC14_3037780 [marine sediment metagenome]|uniref:Zinc/iron-chelating domain-containing protein n=1 Tax=marine sediment metagenome TaxID=412755 RepID=A0A0F8ZGG5_9ZZZZ